MVDITAVLDKAETTASPSEASTEAPAAVETSNEQAVETEVKATPEIKPDSELTPEQLAKREANRQSHLNSKLAKMRRENRELREMAQRLSQQTAPSAKSDAPQPPSEDNFTTWDEFRAAERQYYEQLADWKIEQKLSEREKKTAEVSQADAANSYKAERINKHAEMEAEFAKQVTDYEQTVYGDYGDFMQNLPTQVAEALLEADNASLALYALAKEGLLEQLEDMSPYRLAIEIGKAEIRGQSYLVPKKTTNAPTPMRGAKGITTSKPLSGKEALAMLKR